MKSCCNCCVVNDVECPIDECEHWIEYEEDFNCSLISIEKNGEMTLREVAERMGISFVRVKQIQDRALLKMKMRNARLIVK